MADMEFIKFNEEKVVGSAKVEINLTEKDIDIIISNALEGGIGYWAMLNNTGEKWEKKPSNRFTSEWATQLILDGETIELIDNEDEEEVFSLNLEKIIKGFELNYKLRPFDNDIYNGDAYTSDSIIQYGLFGKLVYG